MANTRDTKEVTVSEDHHTFLKVQSAKEGKTMKELVEDWVEENTDYEE
ncbi:hypothetical protein [Salinibacter grassmerensis]|nr:hypothetical protein [Salinibacter grassmerensis]